MRLPQRPQPNIMLQCSIHQFGTVRAKNRGLESCYQSRGDAYPANGRYVGWIEISPSQTGSIVATAVRRTRHGHVDCVGSELRQLVQPRRRESAGRRAFPVTPYGGADSRSITELAVVDEVHPSTAPSPLASLHSTLHGLRAESGAAGLSERDDSVLITKDIVEHRNNGRCRVSFGSVLLRFRCANDR
jgi:hypothetical protein